MMQKVRHILCLGTLALSSLALANPSDIVVIGDSQSQGSLGKETLKLLRKNHKVKTSYYARPGSVAQWWLDGTKAPQDWSSWNAPEGERELRIGKALPAPKIDALQKKHQPKLVVVQLGGNMVHQSEAAIRKSTEELIRKIRAGGSRCLWVGPNPGEKRPEPKFTRAYEILKEVTAAAGCDFMDSREVITPVPKGGDGIHIDTMKGGKDAAEKWAQAIAGRAVTVLRRPASSAKSGLKGAPLKTHR